ncbi:hypothetical protein [Aeoliella sp. SH292]|uniref:hypothetical protein n=1 Tax=Aeoliella sp. SH292 TaxID=3454464 RepID=UPI003F9AC6AD
MRPLTRLASLFLLAGLTTGCSILIPDVATMPVVHNPFPQLSRVAVAPFFNLSDEPTVNGRDFALAYYAELQSVPGYEVVPLGVVEEAMIRERINLSDPAEARRLAQVLGVDAVVVGAVTDYTPYYPPRCGLRVEWYAANPGFHKIPAGYGLPWGTPDEEYIPQDVVFDAEMALAKEQMATQTPRCDTTDEPPGLPSMNAAPMKGAPLKAAPKPMQTESIDMMPTVPLPPVNPLPNPETFDFSSQPIDMPQSDPDLPAVSEMEEAADPLLTDSIRKDPALSDGFDDEYNVSQDILDMVNDKDLEDDTDLDAPDSSWRPRKQTTYKVPSDAAQAANASATAGTPCATDPASQNNFAMSLPPNWPDPRGFIPPGPSPVPPPCIENKGPVMSHTRIFLGNDPDFTTALAAYVDFRDDNRWGGWRGYLERSDDFIRFCCHLHITEMLAARGGSDETRVVRHWSNNR